RFPEVVFTVPEDEHGLAFCLTFLTQQAFRQGQRSFTLYVYKSVWERANPRATIKAHHPSTQPPSPLRNPRLRLRLMPIGHLQGDVPTIHECDCKGV
ncbi:MAG: hypothetical protein ACXVCM_25855, partial [Ktedonobacteraceae bacterium]